MEGRLQPAAGFQPGSARVTPDQGPIEIGPQAQACPPTGWLSTLNMVGACLFVFLATAASAQSPDGLFLSKCGPCHNNANNVNAPLPDTLKPEGFKRGQ